MLRDKVEQSEHFQRQLTGKQAIAHVVKRYLVDNQNSTSVYDLERTLRRLRAEAELLGEDGANAKNHLAIWSQEVDNLLAADQSMLSGEAWLEWIKRLNVLKRNPLFIGPADDDSETDSNTNRERAPISPPYEVVSGQSTN